MPFFTSHHGTASGPRSTTTSSLSREYLRIVLEARATASFFWVSGFASAMSPEAFASNTRMASRTWLRVTDSAAARGREDARSSARTQGMSRGI